MIKNYFQKYGTKIVSKMAKYILVLLVASVTWVVAISPSMYKRGEQLYEQGKLFYNEEKAPSPSTMFYQENSDSSIINIIEKEEKWVRLQQYGMKRRSSS